MTRWKSRRKKNPDVVLLDLEMPVFDGMTAAETIINENLAGCVVICTAFADEDFLEQAGPDRSVRIIS